MEMESMSSGFLKIVSLSRVASLINVIFVCSRRKHNFLVPSLSHSMLSHSFSPHTLIDTNLGLSSSHRSLSLSLFSMFLFPSITQFFDQIFSPSLISQQLRLAKENRFAAVIISFLSTKISILCFEFQAQFSFFSKKFSV